MSSSTTERKPTHEYQLRDQTGDHAHKSKSMLIGKLPHTGTGIWVSYDKRSRNGDLTRYWKDDRTKIPYQNFVNILEYREGLESSRFTSKKTSKPDKPSQKLKQMQRDLIKLVYDQRGKQYEGDLEKVKANKAAKNDTGKLKSDTAKAGKSKNTTPRKTRKVNAKPNSILDSFQHKAQEIPITLDNVKSLHDVIAEEWQHAPPVAVIKDSLEQAHRLKEPNAMDTAPYMTWLATSGHKSQGVTEEEEEDWDSDISDARDTEDEEEYYERGGRSAGNIDTSGEEDGDTEEEECETGGPSAGNVDTSDGEDEVEKEEQGRRIDVVISSREESSESDEEEDEEGTTNQSNEKEGSIAGKEDEKDDEEGGMELGIEEGGMEVGIEEGGMEVGMEEGGMEVDASPLERTLTSTTPAEDEGQALQRQHTSAWSARQAHNPEANIQRMSQFFNRKR